MEELFYGMARLFLIVAGLCFTIVLIVGAGHCLYVVLTIISGLADRVLRILERHLR